MRVSPDFASPLDPPPAQSQEPPGSRPNPDPKRASLKQGWAGRADNGRDGRDGRDISGNTGNNRNATVDYDDGAWM